MEILWRLLEREELREDIIQVLQGMYNESEVQIACEGLKDTEPVVKNRSSKQGCPLPPLLFMQHKTRLERKLENSKIGFNLR